MRIFLSLALILIYWSFDSYSDVLNYNITFSNAILLNYPQSNPLIKVLTSIFILIFMLISTNKKEEKLKEEDSYCSSLMINAIYKITDITLSPLPLHKQLNNIVSVMEENFKIKTAFIGSFEKDSIFILNTNESLKEIGIEDKYLPHRENLTKSSLNSLLSICYMENRNLVDDFVTINGVRYRVIIEAYKSNTLKKSMGIVAIVLDENEKLDYSNFLSKVCEQIAFSINLINKKDEVIKTQNNFNEHFLSIDTQLQIPNNSKLQEMIEHEIKRSQRYHTQLSLIIIEIDHFKNLSNIFTKDETMTLRKELATLFKKEVRETDLFGKWAADDFAIIAPDIDFRAAKNLANKLNKILKGHRFSKVGKITCSYGITSFCEKDTIGGFRQRAENALKTAIERGGNNIEVKILV